MIAHEGHHRQPDEDRRGPCARAAGGFFDLGKIANREPRAVLNDCHSGPAEINEAAN